MDFHAATEVRPPKPSHRPLQKRLQRPRTSVVYDKELERLYSDPIWFYDSPPDFSISLYEFDTYAQDRLKLLRTIDRLNTTSNAKGSTEYQRILANDLGKQGLVHFQKLVYGSNAITDELLAARKYDHISHYILRLAFCRTEELRKWLIAMEMTFFTLRLVGGATAFDSVIKKYNLPVESVSVEEKTLLSVDLANATFHMENSSIPDSPTFYKVGFAYAMDLVKNRKVLLKGGFAYIPQNNVSAIIVSEFRSRLSEALAATNKLTPMIEEDERLKDLLHDFDKKYTGANFVAKGSDNSLTAEMLPELSKKSFPLCMKSLYDVVSTDHHLKHWGRLQLGLFFKGAGLKLEESVKFWRTNFTKKTDIDANRFDKQYLYNIRHMYGQEGKRADYTPYNCMKVIMQNVGPGESHGCPFRHSDETPLRTKLVAAEIPAVGIKEIMDLIEKHHYQIACQKYFEWTHNQATVEGGVTHPNQYFLESKRVQLGKQPTKAAVRIPTKRRVIYEDGSTQSPSDQDEIMESSDPVSPNDNNCDMMDDDEIDIEKLINMVDN